MTFAHSIDFEKMVKEAFNFLVDKYGYLSHVDSAEGSVTFSNGLVSVRVFREPRSYMIYVEVCRADTGEEYLLHEILRAVAPDETLPCQCSGADRNKTALCLRQLSQLCKRHLHGALTMHNATFEKVSKSAAKMRQEYTLEAEYGAIKDSANVAWEQKEWDKARILYEKARPALSLSEKRRLDFLTKKSAE